MRRYYVISLAVITAVLMFGTILFAYSYGPRFNYNFKDSDRVTLKGKLIYDNRRLAELESGGKVYKIAFPYFIIDELKIKDKDNVEIEGYKTTGNYCPYPFVEDDEEVVVVSKVTYNGKSYDIDKELKDNNYGPGWGCGRGGYGGRNYDRRSPRGRGMWY
ncbi:MAG: hypothetical protein JXB50_13990 [Spirochaetes bacterium]|nr:hypothetical protein [Spirochaetota bacterium]